MQLAHAVDRTSSSNRQIRHVERLVRIVGTSPAKGQQILKTDVQTLGGVPVQIEMDQRGRKSVEPRCYGRVCRKQVSGARRGERYCKTRIVFIHKGERALEHGERGVALVEMTDLGVLSQLFQEAPSGDSQDQL